MIEKKNFIITPAIRIFLFSILFYNNAFAESDSTKYIWQKIPGSEYKVQLPEYFKTSDTYEGFLYKNSGISLVFKEFKDYNYKLYHAGYIAKTNYHSANGAQLIDIDTISLRKLQGYLYSSVLKPTDASVDYYQKLFIFGNARSTKLFMINFPAPVNEEAMEYLHKAVLSLKRIKP